MQYIKMNKGDEYGFYCDPEEYYYIREYYPEYHADIESLTRPNNQVYHYVEHKLNEKQKNYLICVYIFTIFVISVEFWIFT
jgi:hypothetical protein